MLLAGDVGGTKADLAVFSHSGGPRQPLARRQFPTRDARGLDEIAREFLAGLDPAMSAKITAASFDVAGPVVDGHASLPNLPWEADAGALRSVLALESVVLMNDLEATANAIPLLEGADLNTQRRGSARYGGPIGVIAPGTGLGEGFLTWDGQGYRVHPSEGGHGDFAPVDREQLALLDFMWDRVEHVSYERVCSGVGLPHIYAFLASRGDLVEEPAVAAELSRAADQAPVIVRAALDDSAPSARCRAAVDLFLRILGAEAGNLALRVVATGGVYIAGGLPPRVLSRFADSGFIDAFEAKGRESSLVGAMPVHVVLEQVALYGAARRGLELMPPQDD